MYLIIVLYFPNKQQIDNIVEICRCNNCIIIDNTPNIENRTLRYLCLNKRTQVIYIPLKINHGIAVAQNIAIEEAKQRNAQYILFLDQDSTITQEFPKLLLAEYKKISAMGIKISALGPSLINACNGKAYKIDNTKHENNGYINPSILISSGMFIEMQTLNDIGKMDETLFIDYVDFEWCWRAKAKGYTCCVSQKVTMEHRVGIRDKNILGYLILISFPIRYYYRYRNYLRLCTRKYIPLNWKIKTGIKNILFFIYLPLISKNRQQIWHYMLLGIKDGLR